MLGCWFYVHFRCHNFSSSYLRINYIVIQSHIFFFQTTPLQIASGLDILKTALHFKVKLPSSHLHMLGDHELQLMLLSLTLPSVSILSKTCHPTVNIIKIRVYRITPAPYSQYPFSFFEILSCIPLSNTFEITCVIFVSMDCWSFSIQSLKLSFNKFTYLRSLK